MNNKIKILILFVGILVLSGCGKLQSSGQEITAVGPYNDKLEKLNTDLGQISTVADAENVINNFLSYASENLSTSNIGCSTSGIKTAEINASSPIMAELVTSLANKELAFRKSHPVNSASNQSIKLKSMDRLDDAGILPIDIAGAVNLLINPEGNPDKAQVSIENAEELQTGVRSALPNIAPDSTDVALSPMEVLVSAYYISTTDDGSQNSEIKSKEVNENEIQAKKYMFEQLTRKLLAPDSAEGVQ